MRLLEPSCFSTRFLINHLVLIQQKQNIKNVCRSRKLQSVIFHDYRLCAMCRCMTAFSVNRICETFIMRCVINQLNDCVVWSVFYQNPIKIYDIWKCAETALCYCLYWFFKLCFAFFFHSATPQVSISKGNTKRIWLVADIEL